jgi:hypothetical protein
MMSSKDSLFVLWCRLTGNDPCDFGEDEREAFLARPQVRELAELSYPELLDAGVTAARRGSLPLERWLGAARSSRVGADH